MSRRLPLAIALALTACGGGSDETPDAGFDCDRDDRDEEFVAGMEKTGENGLTFRLVSSDPTPPQRNDNLWVIEVEDGGDPLVGAAIEVTPFMPDHNHGTPIRAVVTPDPAIDGRYQVERVNLFMPGIWEITIEATPAGGGPAEADEAVFVFCVQA